MDYGSRVGLNFFNCLKHLANFRVNLALCSEIDIAVGVGGIVSVVHQLPIITNLAVIAPDQSEQPEDGAFVYLAKRER